MKYTEKLQLKITVGAKIIDIEFTDVPEFVGKVRTDRRCGSEFPLPDGGPSQCDPDGDNHCCSKWGFCGPDAEHCECEECIDYKKGDLTGISVIFKYVEFFNATSSNMFNVISI